MTNLPDPAGSPSGGDGVCAITLYGDTYTGVQIGGKGLFRHTDGRSYGGAVADTKPHGLGVLNGFNGTIWSGGWSAGYRDGPFLERWASGSIGYYLYDRGNAVHWAAIGSDGECTCDGQLCADDDARLPSLKAAALDAAVRQCTALPCAAPAGGPEHHAAHNRCRVGMRGLRCSGAGRVAATRRYVAFFDAHGRSYFLITTIIAITGTVMTTTILCCCYIPVSTAGARAVHRRGGRSRGRGARQAAVAIIRRSPLDCIAGR
jgi:hypothetical protein